MRRGCSARGVAGMNTIRRRSAVPLAQRLLRERSNVMLARDVDSRREGPAGQMGGGESCAVRTMAAARVANSGNSTGSTAAAVPASGILPPSPTGWTVVARTGELDEIHHAVAHSI